MFIFTTKFSKKKALAVTLILALVLIGIVLFAGSRNSSPAAPQGGPKLKSNEDIVKYLTSIGWEISPEPIDSQEIVIPKEFDDVYEEYNNIQISQGYDLKNYSGAKATRYTYKVTNYPDSTDNVVLDIIIYKNAVIGGDVQSTSIDGFMQGLKYPELSN